MNKIKLNNKQLEFLEKEFLTYINKPENLYQIESLNGSTGKRSNGGVMFTLVVILHFFLAEFFNVKDALDPVGKD